MSHVQSKSQWCSAPCVHHKYVEALESPNPPLSLSLYISLSLSLSEPILVHKHKQRSPNTFSGIGGGGGEERARQAWKGRPFASTWLCVVTSMWLYKSSARNAGNAHLSVWSSDVTRTLCLVTSVAHIVQKEAATTYTCTTLYHSSWGIFFFGGGGGGGCLPSNHEQANTFSPLPATPERRWWRNTSTKSMHLTPWQKFTPSRSAQILFPVCLSDSLCLSVSVSHPPLNEESKYKWADAGLVRCFLIELFLFLFFLLFCYWSLFSTLTHGTWSAAFTFLPKLCLWLSAESRLTSSSNHNSLSDVQSFLKHERSFSKWINCTLCKCILSGTKVYMSRVISMRFISEIHFNLWLFKKGWFNFS